MKEVDFNDIKSISEELVEKMLNRYLGVNYTIWINVWQDDTFYEENTIN